jgi:hypothetical protein
MNRQQAEHLRRIEMLRRYAINRLNQEKAIVGWVSDSVTQHIEAEDVGLRLAPNPTYNKPNNNKSR